MVDSTYPEMFMIYNWYKKFHDLTIETKFLPLEQAIIDYVFDEKFFHPDEYFVDSHDVQSFKTAIFSIIKTFGGTAYVKLLWSSPKDSGWLCLNGKPNISSFDELCLIIKNSNNLFNDLKLITSGTVYHPSLALRRTITLEESMEFRCFIKDNKFIGCCQRNIDTYYDFLFDEKTKILAAIIKFISEIFLPRWDLEPSLIMDVFLNPAFKVTIMDIGPFDYRFVDPILFEWVDFSNQDETSLPLFRIIPSPDYIIRDTKINNGLPLEWIQHID